MPVETMGPGQDIWNDHVDRIIAVLKSVEMHRLTLLTGSNASGKSVIRKQLPFYVSRAIEGADVGHCVASLSFMTRAGLDTRCGINFFRDNDWNATSQNSIGLARSILDTADRYIVLDEPEIGMSEEMQLSLALLINRMKGSCLEKSHGLMVITHSRIIARELDNDCFINLDGFPDKESWLNREIVPVDLDEFKAKADGLFEAIRDREAKGDG